MIKTVRPSECSRANGRRIEDSTRYVKTLLSRVKEIQNVANETGYEIKVVRKLT